MGLDDSLIEIREYDGEGYLPLVDYQSWRVAILRYIDELLPERIDTMERHDETDEVFVLLAGRCLLFIGEPGSDPDGVERIHPVDMQALRLYNIKKGCFHTHTLDEAATVLIVENRDTTAENSTQVTLSEEQQEELIRLTREVWGKRENSKDLQD
ncbi:MAG TPA: hypothetical protein VMT46_01575 [Anaerolineaceae bacterium]|nr:hypothetical protein [Anaerolineaceae bacterium]